MLLHRLGKLKIQIFCRYSADMAENANKLHVECTNFNSSTCVTVYAEYIYLLTEYLKYLSIGWLFYSIKCGWLWKEPVGYSECSKWRPFASSQARNRSPHLSIASSVTVCGLWNAWPSVNMRRCLRSEPTHNFEECSCAFVWLNMSMIMHKARTNCKCRDVTKELPTWN